MKKGEVPIQGGPRKKSARLRLGFSGEEFSYAISLGLPTPSSSVFSLDPQIKRECIWVGNVLRPASMLVDRDGPVIKIRSDRSWEVVEQHWIAALLTPRPPPLIVLNEPETSLYPDLLPALARLITRAAESTQVWVVSHASRLISALEEPEQCNSLRLEKNLGQTQVVD